MKVRKTIDFMRLMKEPEFQDLNWIRKVQEGSYKMLQQSIETVFRVTKEKLEEDPYPDGKFRHELIALKQIDHRIMEYNSNISVLDFTAAENEVPSNVITSSGCLMSLVALLLHRIQKSSKTGESEIYTVVDIGCGCVPFYGILLEAFESFHYLAMDPNLYIDDGLKWILSSGCAAYCDGVGYPDYETRRARIYKPAFSTPLNPVHPHSPVQIGTSFHALNDLIYPDLFRLGDYDAEAVVKELEENFDVFFMSDNDFNQSEWEDAMIFSPIARVFDLYDVVETSIPKTDDCEEFNTHLLVFVNRSTRETDQMKWFLQQLSKEIEILW